MRTVLHPTEIAAPRWSGLSLAWLSHGFDRKALLWVSTLVRDVIELSAQSERRVPRIGRNPLLQVGKGTRCEIHWVLGRCLRPAEEIPWSQASKTSASRSAPRAAAVR